MKLIKFYAEWCGPCRRLAPLISEVKEKFSELEIIEVNTDIEKELVNKHNITSIPVIVLEKDGEEVERFCGLVQKSTLFDSIKKHIEVKSKDSIEDLKQQIYDKNAIIINLEKRFNMLNTSFQKQLDLNIKLSKDNAELKRLLNIKE